MQWFFQLQYKRNGVGIAVRPADDEPAITRETLDEFVTRASNWISKAPAGEVREVLVYSKGNMKSTPVAHVYEQIEKTEYARHMASLSKQKAAERVAID